MQNKPPVIGRVFILSSKETLNTVTRKIFPELVFYLNNYILPTGEYKPASPAHVKAASPPPQSGERHNLTQRASFVFTDNKGRSAFLLVGRLSTESVNYRSKFEMRF